MLLTKLLRVTLFISAVCWQNVCVTSVCQCVRVKDCASIAQSLLHHQLEEREAIFSMVRNAVCGFQGLDTLICCPTQHKISKHFSRNQRFVPPENRWVWDAVTQPRSPSTIDPHEVEMRLHDYHDFHAKRNYPQLLDGDLDASYFGYDGTQHFNYRIQHEHVSETQRPPPKDRPIVFPGDLRFHKTDEFPTVKGKLTADSSQEQVVREMLPEKPVVVGTSTTSRVNPRDCGISLSTRLLGGQSAAPGQYPWLARIAYRNRTNGRISYRCSGSLILNQYIVTAAHCVVNLVSDLEVFQVRIGDDAHSQQDCAASAVNCNNPNIFDIGRVLVHPNYDQPKYANDIALLSLRSQKPITFTPICLPLNGTTALADRLIGQTGVVAGWRSNAENNSSASMATSISARFIRLPIVNTTRCAIAYASISENFQQPIVITPRHLCAQGQPMNDVCRGDSGGPFMDDGTSGLLNANGRHTLLGIVAFGPTLCGVSTIPGVYTAVNSYTNWIYDSIGMPSLQ